MSKRLFDEMVPKLQAALDTETTEEIFFELTMAPEAQGSWVVIVVASMKAALLDHILQVMAPIPVEIALKADDDDYQAVAHDISEGLLQMRSQMLSQTNGDVSSHHLPHHH